MLGRVIEHNGVFLEKPGFLRTSKVYKYVVIKLKTYEATDLVKDHNLAHFVAAIF